MKNWIGFPEVINEAIVKGTFKVVPTLILSDEDLKIRRSSMELNNLIKKADIVMHISDKGDVKILTNRYGNGKANHKLW
tara:strand:+ start:152 stop:388 length:237 start_codon:yes stop_codon:yes gene_type:complete